MSPRQIALPPTLAPRLINREAAAAYVGVSPNTFDAMIDKGLMPKPRILPGCRRKVWDVRELDIAVDALPRDGEELAAADEGWT
jgi:predicted DNA-binding transcriptional regulator AlpA